MAFLLTLLSFVRYLVTMNGTIPSYRDSGDLIASAASLGIAHPPAYPFYLVLTNLLSRGVPWGSLAYRVNLMSALSSSIAIGFLYLTARTWAEEPGPSIRRLSRWSVLEAAFFATGFCALAPAVVDLSQVAEMYATGLLLASLILFILFCHPHHLPLAVFLLGLGMGVHPTLLFLVPILAACFYDQRRVGRSLSLLGLGICFALGLSIFIFLPVRSTQSPLENWGHPTTWRNFWRVITRADYGGLKLHPVESEFSWTPASVAAQLVYFCKMLYSEWGGIGVVLALVGLHRSLKPGTSLTRKAVLPALLIAGPGFFVLSNLPLGEPTTPAILQPYLLLVELLGALWIAGGIAFLLRDRREWARIVVLVVAIVGLYYPIRLTKHRSHRDDFYTYDYGRNLMRSLPAGSVMFDPDDPTAFTLRALQITEDRRPDIILLNFFRTRWGYEELKTRWPDLLPPVALTNAADLERVLWTYSLQRHPFFVELPQKLPSSMPYATEGLVYAANVKPGPETFRRAEQLLGLYVRRGDGRTLDHDDFFTRHLLSYYSAAQSNLGLQYAAAGQSESAARQYWEALTIEPTLAAAYNNLGILDYQKKNYTRAISFYSKAVEFDPSNSGMRANLELAQEAAGRGNKP